MRVQGSMLNDLYIFEESKIKHTKDENVGMFNTVWFGLMGRREMSKRDTDLNF
jgi:hypothetical protein